MRGTPTFVSDICYINSDEVEEPDSAVSEESVIESGEVGACVGVFMTRQWSGEWVMHAETCIFIMGLFLICTVRGEQKKNKGQKKIISLVISTKYLVLFN